MKWEKEVVPRVNSKLSMGIKLLVAGSEEKWENGVEGASVNEIMPMGNYLENTVNTVIKITAIGNTGNTVIVK